MAPKKKTTLGSAISPEEKERMRQHMAKLQAPSLSEELLDDGRNDPEYLRSVAEEHAAQMGITIEEWEELNTKEHQTLKKERASHYTVTSTHQVEKRTMAIFNPKDYGIGTIPEPIAMPDGYEAHLRIVSVRKAVNKNGDDYFQPILEIVDEPMAKDFTHYMVVPNRDTMSPKQVMKAGFDIQEFMQGFGIDMDEPGDPQEMWPGHEARNILGVTEEKADYGRQNKLGKFVPF